MFHIASSTSSPKFPDYLSENVKNFLSKCFIRNPKLRPNATELLNEPWLKDVKVNRINNLLQDFNFPISPYSSPSLVYETNEEYVE